MDDRPEITPHEPEDRLQYLKAAPKRKPQDTQRYSNFIKWIRLSLPVLAIGIIALVFSWYNFQSPNIAPVTPPETENNNRIAKNELLNPRFESVDNKNQPFVITANRALQSTGEDDLLILEKAYGDLTLNSGRWLAVKADQAAYTQAAGRLLLKENVQLFHDEGYTMRTAELDVEIDAGLANSTVDVEINGPAGTLNAKGVKADNQNELLVFNGPAKLVLFQNNQKSPLEGLMP